MQMRPPVQIKSVIKSLTDVVIPAIDPHNKLAQEQVRLCIGVLALMSQQLPLQFRFDCDELARLIAFSNELQKLARGGAATSAAIAALSQATQDASATLDAAKSAPDDIEHQVRELRAASGTLITQVFADGDPACRSAVSDTVLAMSKQQLLRDRSWMLMQNWESDPKAIPPITELLGA